MATEDQLLDKAINIYLTGLKGLESFISEPASEYNLSFEQFLILRMIISHPNIKLMDIAEQRQVTRSAVSRQLKILFRQAYVEQKADPADRRRMFLIATAKGVAVETKIWQKITQRFSKWVQIYGKDRADQFLTLFEDFNQQIIQGKIRKRERDND
ncbi:MarR family transcriptional regulator [Limosilactobacillus sp. STM2_1]|uniref:MarR family transcriptional regulator n=1 Tax=Limosilactobacillus rudii TaxID=2759755 RepID=A0A7W3UMK3_9LACO|nr:MarR family transcriptional regulator [Limosilactobacillus rudii]MBB1080311.1 MarR family transcriptional regulator [Limosilactobacillus rudii]MBB1098337.1 MarR family transcriptional regulator [Limosilactobacillus rudii]MCD7135345.1 MarR family transcriptional regulator [Limosilactobacillus rudii]